MKYTGLPVNYDTPLHILETDYDSYAVIWSCNPLVGAIGHTGKRRKIISIEKTKNSINFIILICLESVWILTRERIPDGPVLQAAYGVLDKYKIS